MQIVTRGVPRLGAPIAAVVLSLGGAGAHTSAASPTRSMYQGFAHPRPVLIRGYAGSAMEPFVTPDGKYLLFNNSNAAMHTTLRYATRVDDTTFLYRGAVSGANDATALTAVPAVTANETLFFISTRSYARSLSTVYEARFHGGTAAGVSLVAGLAAPRRGIINFDVDVSSDGNSLYVSQGTFSGGSAPEAASIVEYTRSNGGFVRSVSSDRVLKKVNDPAALTYAADISPDGLELFFTRGTAGAPPQIYRAARSAPSLPFGDVELVGAATGFVEAPALSGDGRLLFFHRHTGDHFSIYVASRA